MSAPNEQAHSLLGDHQTPLPETPIDTPPVVATSVPYATYPRHRPGYARVPSISIINENPAAGTTDSADEDDITQAQHSSHGLGIALGTGESNPSQARRVSIQPVRRMPVGTRTAPEQGTPDSAAPLMSPPSTGGFSGSTRRDSPEMDTSYSPFKHMGKQSTSSLHSYAKSDAGLLSVRSRYDEFAPDQHCRSHKRVKERMGSWISTTILVLGVFSTVFSGAYLIIALRGPHYGRAIRTNGVLTASSAAFLTSIIAKLIELSFVTVMVAFLGQALARRAYKQNSRRGVNLAELSMRSWIMQPGTLLTQWSTVRYAGVSFLGGVSLLAAVVALLYTSAATALVQPQLKFPPWSPKVMQGLVKTTFANPNYIGPACKTPITTTYDPVDSAATCIQLEHAAMGYHNYFGFLGQWHDVIYNGTGSPLPSERPKGSALLNDNTTVTAPWVEVTDIEQLYLDHNLIINNVSMAMPHSGIVQVATDPRNGILQPDELDGLGVYSIHLSIPSPVVHVNCVTMNQTQLKPFVYSLWDGVNATAIDLYAWPTKLAYSDPYLNGTPFDEVFRWGEAYGTGQWPPVFPIVPSNFNTLFNDTTNMAYGRDAVYVLGKGGPTDSSGIGTSDDNYALCQLKISQTPFCSTRYNASASGGTLEAICEDSNDNLQYMKSLETASSGNLSISKDAPNILSEWGRSLSLNAGTFAGNASNARLLTQLIVTAPSWGNVTLNPALPSMAEALAVMAGCTLLQAAQDAPFVTFWNYTLPAISPGQYQYINASIRAQQYASGGTQDYQKAFYIVLALLFLMNLGALAYFALHRDWFSDFTEPTNLFSLALNSPPSKELAGSCGGGPQGGQYKVNFQLNSEGDHVFMESHETTAVDSEGSPGLRRRRLSEGFDLMMSPVKKATERWEWRRSD